MTKKSQKLTFAALQKSEIALTAVASMVKKFVVVGKAPSFDDVVVFTRAFTQVTDAMDAIDKTYEDASFTAAEISIIRRMAADGRNVMDIQKRLRRNINLISDYMCEHGLARKMRKALAA